MLFRSLYSGQARNLKKTCFEVKCLIFMALNDCQRRFRENNCRINVYLYGNLNGINVIFGVTVVPIQNF